MSKLSRAAKNRRRRKQKGNGKFSSGNRGYANNIASSSTPNEFQLDKETASKYFYYFLPDNPNDPNPAKTAAEKYAAHLVKIGGQGVNYRNQREVESTIMKFFNDLAHKWNIYRPKQAAAQTQKPAIDQRAAQLFYKKFKEQHPRIRIPANMASRAAEEYVEQLGAHLRDVDTHAQILNIFKNTEKQLQRGY